jgi:hypothetical protein
MRWLTTKREEKKTGAKKENTVNKRVCRCAEIKKE